MWSSSVCFAHFVRSCLFKPFFANSPLPSSRSLRSPQSLAAWEEQASQTASQHFKRSILTVCHSLLTLRTHLRAPDLLPHLKTPIPCDYLDLLDHGSTLGFGLNPDVYCRELVRRVLLFSEGLGRRREGWSVVCERVKRITEVRSWEYEFITWSRNSELRGSSFSQTRESILVMRLRNSNM